MGVEREVGELKSKLDALSASFEDFREEMRRWQNGSFARLIDRLDSHSKRLGALERWRSWLAGGLAMLGLLWAALWSWAKR